MIVYFYVILWITASGLLLRASGVELNCEKKKEKNIVAVYLLMTMGIYVVLSGLRSGIADTPAYIFTFQVTPADLSYIAEFIRADFTGIGFNLLRVLIKVFISQDYHVFLFIIAAISGFFVARGIQKYSTNAFSSMLLFMLTGTYTWMLNGIRQFLVVAIYFSAMDLIVEKKYFKYILLSLLLTTVHTSAIIMLPMIFIVTGETFNRRTILVLLATMVAVSAVSSFTSILSGVLEGTAYEGYTQQFMEDDGVNPLRVLVYSMPCILAFIHRKKIAELNDPKLNVLVNFSLMAVAMSLLALVTSGILIGRLIMYFSIFSLALIPWLIRDIFKSSAGAASAIMYVLYGVYWYLNFQDYYYISDVLHLYVF